jgi:hypothetical protein
MALEQSGFLNKAERDDVFDRYRREGVQHVVKFSEVEPTINPEVPGEILLDKNGRIVYHSLWCIAYA